LETQTGIINYLLGLPLSLSIVGKLILSYDGDWQEEVPQILRTDMSSLTDTQQGGGGAPMNVHARVIQSGIDSIADKDARQVRLHVHLHSALMVLC
jgi:hypothetical protein